MAALLYNRSLVCGSSQRPKTLTTKVTRKQYSMMYHGGLGENFLLLWLLVSKQKKEKVNVNLQGGTTLHECVECSTVAVVADTQTRIWDGTPTIQHRSIWSQQQTTGYTRDCRALQARAPLLLHTPYVIHRTPYTRTVFPPTCVNSDTTEAKRLFKRVIVAYAVSRTAYWHHYPSSSLESKARRRRILILFRRLELADT